MRSLQGITHTWFIIFFSLVFVMLRFPSIIEPNWYGDEGIYQVIGNAISSGKTLYIDVWDNKPPLLYLIYAVGSGSLFFAKLTSLLAGLLSVVLFYNLCKKIFEKEISTLVSSAIFAVLFGLPVIEGNIANAENFMLLPTILAAYFVIQYGKNKTTRNIVIAGLLLSLSFMIKIVAIFDFMAFALFFILTERNFIQSKKAQYFTLAFLSTITIAFLYFSLHGFSGQFLDSVFLKNYSYVGEKNTFIFPMAILLLKTLLLISFLTMIVVFRKRIQNNTLFIYIWISFGLYSAFFSDRPYTHYLLILLPAFALLIGSLFERKRKSIISLALLGVVLLSIFQFRIYMNNVDYYYNFVNFVTNKKSVIEYQSFFDRSTPRDYNVAEFITSNIGKNEKVFLWSDSAQIYALSDRLPMSKYIVSYHVNFYDNESHLTYKALVEEKPEYIIQTALSNEMFEKVLNSYQLRYIINGAKIYERQN